MSNKEWAPLPEKKGDKIVMLKSDLVELCKDIFADGGEDYEKSFESSDSYKWLKDLNVVKK